DQPPTSDLAAWKRPQPTARQLRHRGQRRLCAEPTAIATERQQCPRCDTRRAPRQRNSGLWQAWWLWLRLAGEHSRDQHAAECGSLHGIVASELAATALAVGDRYGRHRLLEPDGPRVHSAGERRWSDQSIRRRSGRQADI